MFYGLLFIFRYANIDIIYYIYMQINIPDLMKAQGHNPKGH